jgi:calcineurin-like phosphoesterase family protein
MNNIQNIQNIIDRITPEIQKDMESLHFCADLHHGHPKIIDICKRPVTKEEHDNWLINEVINKWVKRNHTLYLAGDVSMAKREEAEKFLDKLNGSKFLILGNHDKNINNSTRFKQITQIKDFTYSKFGLNIHIVICHFPFYSWNRKVHGSWHLYGHVHGRLAIPGLAFDIGVDNPELRKITGGVYRPLNLFEIINLMNEKQKLIELENNQLNHSIYK